VSGDHDGSFLVHFFFGPLLLGIEAVRRTQVPQEQDAFGKGTLTDICTDAEHLPDHGVCDVVTQVDQREQHFLIRIELAPPAAAGKAPRPCVESCSKDPCSKRAADKVKSSW